MCSNESATCSPVVVEQESCAGLVADSSPVQHGDTSGLAFPGSDELLEASSLIPGKRVTDLTPANVIDYCCGAFSLVERDIQLVFSPQLSCHILALLREIAIPEAFRLREEVVNYKKVLLHEHRQGLSLERSLAQVASFFHGDASERCGSFWVPDERSSRVSDARQQCQGRIDAAHDTRQLGKAVCSLPRHPQESRTALLRNLPHGLKTWGLAVAAAEKAGMGSGAASPVLEPPRSGHAAAMATLNAQSWPTHVRDFIVAVLICRGADKALRIRDEIGSLIAALDVTLALAEGALDRLRAFSSLQETARRLETEEPGPDELHTASLQTSAQSAKMAGTPQRLVMAAAVHRHRHINFLMGCVPGLQEARFWLGAIESSIQAGETTRLFVAGDGAARVWPGGAPPFAGMSHLCVPPGYKGCKALDDAFFRILEVLKPQMRSTIKSIGWPAHVSRGRADAGVDDKSAEKVCRLCSQHFSSLWIHRGVCCECEDVERSHSRCPFNPKCKSAWFCAHDQRCFICDAHSCEECRLTRGDGEFVFDFVSRLRPSFVALDFDRTLATTKSGCAPVVGKHMLDPELLSLLCIFRGSCAVVTRNPHSVEISAFLAAHGAPSDTPVHVVRKPRSKAEQVAECLERSDVAEDKSTAVIVDDDVAELVDERLADNKRVHRVLFMRTAL